ncbi:hypothetical protein Tco_1530959 [Tanacetum coccineum]
MVKLVVHIESFGKSSNKIDKETVSFNELQLKQANLSCVHALNELHLHEIRVVPTRAVPVPETFHEQTDDELTKAEIKQMEDDDQAIQTILLGLPKDIYAAVDSCETAQEIWLHVQQMMKGFDIGI